MLAHLPKGAGLFAVVKANGYGLGAQPVARAALDGGATGLAVATLEEAREVGSLVQAEHVLVMGGLTPEQAASAASTGCSIGVSSFEFARALGDRDEVVPEDVHPVAVIEYPKKGGGTGKMKTTLAKRCCEVRFYADIHLPKEAVAGRAKVTLSFPAWEDGHVIPAMLEVPVVAGKAPAR